MRFELAGQGIVEVDLGADESLWSLSEAVGVRGTLVLEDVPVDINRPVGTVWDGTRVDLEEAQDGAPTVAEIVGISGIDAAARWRLASGGYDLRPEGGPVVFVDPDGAVALQGGGDGHRPMRVPVGGTFDAGGTAWMVSDLASAGRRPEPVGGRRSFNRPPRRLGVSEPDEIEVPSPPDEPVPRTRMGWAMLAGPVLMGTIMALVFRPIMAVIALVGPLMMATSWLEDRLRIRRFRRENAIVWPARLGDFSGTLARAAQSELDARNRRHPGLVDIAKCSLEMGTPLWERRPHHSDYLQVSVGTGRTRWEPRLRRPKGDEPTAEIESIIDQRSLLPDGPVEVSLLPGTMIGVFGDRSEALALVRAMLVRVAVHHGPADVRLAVVTERVPDWEWCSWLPHSRVDALSGRYRLGADADDVESVVASLSDSGDSDLIVVVDAPGMSPRLRSRLAVRVEAGDVTAVVIEREPEHLPGTCDMVLAVEGSMGTLQLPAQAGENIRFRIDGVQIDVATLISRHVFGVDDPEEDSDGARLPAGLTLAEVVDNLTGLEAMEGRWQNPPEGLLASLGMTENGSLEVDLVADGPHALVAGTTGSGKSELLRTLVGSLAARYGPDLVTFALVDYKGGSAFDACAGLPHVVGVVTDLDRQQGKRALRSLEAELRHREELLRAAEEDNIESYQQSDCVPSMARLLVVIDEFAALAADIPEFVPSLVDIAQRGRSLGVHLVLATQRPAGIVSDSIRANTNLRVALRVQTIADSRDVIDEPVAARLPRRYPGRGFIRLGPGELVPFQTARSTAVSGSADKLVPRARAVRFGWEPIAPEATTESVSGITDLELVAAAAVKVAANLGMDEPRPPWAPELPETLELDEPADEGYRKIGLVDEPELQRVSDLVWEPDQGGILTFGVDGSGASDALVATAFAAARHADPGRLHIYGLDGGGGALHEIEAWPHVGGIAGVADRERATRLVRRLSRRLDERRRGTSAETMILVVIDRLAAVLAMFDGPSDLLIRETLIRVLVDGPSFGILPVASAVRPGALPATIASSISQRLCFRLADPFEYAAVGLTARDIPDLGRGRGFDAEGRMIQIGGPSNSGVQRLLESKPTAALPEAIRALPDRVPIDAVMHQSQIAEDGWFLPVGIGDTDLLPVGFELHAGDHVLIAGPARSGRTTTLASIARLAAAADAGLEIIALSRAQSALDDVAGTTSRSAHELFEAIEARTGPALILVDDAERVDHASFGPLLSERSEGLHIVAAGRADALRGLFQHWTRDIRRCRLGVSLRPQADLDGELWQTQFPRRGPSFRQPGRGYLVSGGQFEVVQVAAS